MHILEQKSLVIFKYLYFSVVIIIIKYLYFKNSSENWCVTDCCADMIAFSVETNIHTSWGRHFSMCSISTLSQLSRRAWLEARKQVSVTKHLATSTTSDNASLPSFVLLSWNEPFRSSLITSYKLWSKFIYLDFIYAIGTRGRYIGD